MVKIVDTEQEFDTEHAKIAELFYKFMEFHKQNKDKKLTYIVLCTANTPQDLKNLLEDKENVDVYLEGFHASQGYGTLISLMLAGELDKETLTDAIDLKEHMEKGIEAYEKITKH